MKGFYTEKLSKRQKALRRRILEISYSANYSHLGSCLSSIDLIDAIYDIKKKNEIFVLSNGHAGVALYVILEKYGLIKKDVIKKLAIHPERDLKLGIHVSTGSLGQGLPIAVGMALADRSQRVYCLISDGECAEGSIWESLRIASELKLENLTILVNANGWGAYDPINLASLIKRIRVFEMHVVKVDGHNINSLTECLKIKNKNKPLLLFAKTTVEQLPFLKGQDAHYRVMQDEDYNLALKILT